MIDHITVGAIATNCWILPLKESREPSVTAMPQECIIIDPGADAKHIIAQLEKQQLYPRYILLTHGHFDHIAALPGLRAYFGGWGQPLDIAIHRDDAERLGPDSLDVHMNDFMAVGAAAYVQTLWEPMPEPTILLSEGDRIGPFTTLHLPGHSPGSAGFYDEKRKILFSGDTLFNNGIGRTDLPGGNDRLMRDSLNRLFSMDPGISVYPGHGPETTIGQR